MMRYALALMAAFAALPAFVFGQTTRPCVVRKDIIAKPLEGFGSWIGNVSKIVVTDVDASGKEDPSGPITVEIDVNGRAVISYFSDSKTGAKTSPSKYAYNSKGQLVQRVQWLVREPWLEDSFEYNADGNLTSAKTKRVGKGQPIAINEKYSYGKGGIASHYLQGGSFVYAISSPEFDDRCNPVRIVYKKHDGTADHTEARTFDRNGNLLEYEYILPDGGKLTHQKFEYVFDTQGNWTTRKEYRISGGNGTSKLESEKRRDISYRASSKQH